MTTHSSFDPRSIYVKPRFEWESWLTAGTATALCAGVLLLLVLGVAVDKKWF